MSSEEVAEETQQITAKVVCDDCLKTSDASLWECPHCGGEEVF